MSNIFMISDLHFGHENMIKYENRPFLNSDNMEEILIKNRNKVVSRDKVFVMGDFSFNDKESTTRILTALRGHKTLIMGNHDRHKTVSWWKEVGFDEVSPFPIIYKDFYILSHEPVYLNECMPYINIHGHTHSTRFENSQFFNICVECNNYTPVNFLDIEKHYNIKHQTQGEIT